MKFSIKIGLHVKPNNAGQAVADEVGIRLRVSWAGRRCDLRSGYVIAPAKWDAANSCVRLGCKNSYRQTASEINRALTRQASTVEEVLTRFELDHAGAAPSVAEFKALFDEAEGRAKAKPAEEAPKAPGFFQVFDKFTAEVGITNNWTPATYTKFNAIRKHVEAWRAGVSLADFDKADFASWVSYLQNTAKLLNTTVAKNVGFLRWFLRWAAANGYYSGQAHENYRPRFKGLDCKEVIFLSWDELQHFLTFEFAPEVPSFGQVRDVFCFCCFTGLRYSDAAKLRRSDLHLEAKPPYMSVVTKKTTDRLRIELNKYALAILEKYADVGLPGDKALPVISNQKMNEHLHDAAEAAGLNEPVNIVAYAGNLRQERVVPKYEVLTTHAGRRTFVVNALRLGIPPAVIMKWTGHSDFKAMRPYIEIVDEAKVENMELFNTFGEAPAVEVPENVPGKANNNE